MPRIAYETPQFRDDFRRASRQAQARIEAFIRKFDQDAARGGTRLKTPQKAADPRVKVARVDQGLRAVLIDLGDKDYALVRVMEHDSAYVWANRLRPDVSTFNGMPRLLTVELREGQADSPPAAPAPTDLFAHRQDKDFLAVGVPATAIKPLRHMPDVRAVEAFADLLGTSDPLLGLAINGLVEDRSIDELYSELLDLEGQPAALSPETIFEGESPSPEPLKVDTRDFGAALQRTGADERFRVVDDSEELIAALNGDFAAWQIFLHPLQRQAAYERTYNGPARVSGGAGTGKTVVLLHRVKGLLDQAPAREPPRILLSTFTTHLKQDLDRLLVQLIGPDNAHLVDVLTVDELARRLHASMTGATVERLAFAQEIDLWEGLAAMAPGRSPVFLRNEYQHVVLARGARSLEDYLTASRAGRGVPLGRSERQRLWPIFEAFEARTRQVDRYSTLQLTESVAALLERLPAHTYDHVLVDEAQDLHPSQWRLLRAVVPPGPDDLFMAGDAYQRIYGHVVSLRGLGIETRGRSTRLRRNYRTTHEIIEWALGIVGDAAVVDIDDLGADLSGYHSVRRGPRPRVAAFDDRSAELAGIVDIVRAWLDDGHAEEAIAVAARNRIDAGEIAEALQRAGVAAARLGRRGRLDGAVNVATMHRLKGLEFPCVAVTGLDAARVPPDGAVCPEEEDRTQHLIDLQAERSLIYVAATRARDELALTWSGTASHLLNARLTPGTAAAP